MELEAEEVVIKMESNGEKVILILPSDAAFPGNKIGNFTIPLDQPLSLWKWNEELLSQGEVKRKEWECAITEVIYPTMWEDEDDSDIFTLQCSLCQPAHVGGEYIPEYMCEFLPKKSLTNTSKVELAQWEPPILQFRKVKPHLPDPLERISISLKHQSSGKQVIFNRGGKVIVTLLLRRMRI